MQSLCEYSKQHSKWNSQRVCFQGICNRFTCIFGWQWATDNIVLWTFTKRGHSQNAGFLVEKCSNMIENMYSGYELKVPVVVIKYNTNWTAERWYACYFFINIQYTSTDKGRVWHFIRNEKEAIQIIKIESFWRCEKSYFLKSYITDLWTHYGPMYVFQIKSPASYLVEHSNWSV